jgi:hypothetical protein
MQHVRITRWPWRLYVHAFPHPYQSRQTAALEAK